MLDLVIRNGLIVLESGVVQGAVGVKNGVIVCIGDAEQSWDAREVLDVEGKFIFPGFIDPHVHCWDPGRGIRDDWYYASRAAVAGGVTTIIEHPLSIPPVRDAETFEMKRKTASKKSCVDFALWGALIPDNLEKLQEMYDKGAVAFKGFISYCNEDYPHIPDSTLYEALKLSEEKGFLLAVHAENAEMADTGEKRMRALGRRDPLAHLESRDEIVEMEAVNRVIFFTEQTGGHMHIVHMTIAKGAELIRMARHRGVDISAETCPHYITADCLLLKERAGFAKCTPPLRSAENTRAMWEYVKDGTISMIASDHTDYLYEEKLAAKHDIWACENGMPGVATLAPLTIDACMNAHGFSAEKTAELLAANAAKKFGIYPRKGSIRIGADADFAIVDPGKEWTINGEELYYKQKWSPYDGWKVRGAVETTIIRGRVVYDNKVVLAEGGYGQFINPREI
ncbi:allantoinase AllB [Lachnospiraceae bacterium 62-26]|jgi:allantoinase